MRAPGLELTAAALCVCCVLPSFDAVDNLPGEGQGASSSSGASSSKAGSSNLTNATGGKSNGSGGSATGNDGGDEGIGTSGSNGSGGTDTGNGGVGPTGGMPGGGTPSGGAAGSTSGAGGGGVPPVGGMGGTGGMGGSSGTGGGGSSQCQTWCQGANSIIQRCPNDLTPSISSEATCNATCQESPAANVNCWVTHLGYVDSPGSPHCAHATGAPNNGVCPPR